MGSFADFWEQEALDHLFNKGAYTAPTIYVGLSTVDPADDESGLAEPVGNNYSRVTTAAGDWNLATAAGLIDNLNALTFPQASGPWGDCTHFALFDAPTAGNMLAHGALGTSKDITSGDTPEFAAGDLDVSLD